MTTSLPSLNTLRFLAYNAVGIATEAGPTPYDRAANAGGASGQSIGVIQTDFKAREKKADLYVQKVADWVNDQNSPTLSILGEEDFARRLKTNSLTKEDRQVISAFGSSDEGMAWIHENLDKPNLDSM